MNKKMKKLIILAVMLFSLTSVYIAHAITNIYGFNALTGGTLGSLDSISPADGSMAIGQVTNPSLCVGTGSNTCSVEYLYSISSTAAANTPSVIEPISGTGRWLISYPYFSPAYVVPYARALANPYIDAKATSGVKLRQSSKVLHHRNLCVYNSTGNKEDCDIPMTTFQVATSNLLSGTGAQYTVPYFTSSNTLGNVVAPGTNGYVLTYMGPNVPPAWTAGGGGNGDMTYPGVGIVVSTGSSWDTSIAVNSILRTISSSTNGDIVLWSGAGGNVLLDSGYNLSQFVLSSTVGAGANQIVQRDSGANIPGNVTGTATNLSGMPSLPNGTTATTQSTAATGTAVATLDFVHNNVAAVGSSGTFTLTASGFSGTVTTTGRYTLINQTVTLEIDSFTGTSNSDVFNLLGIPSNLKPARDQFFGSPNQITNNGTNYTSPAGSGFSITTGGTMWFVYNSSQSGWTASGTKGISQNFTITYNLL